MKLCFILLFLLISCGVKGPPIPPAKSELPSFIKEYNDTFDVKKESVEKTPAPGES